MAVGVRRPPLGQHFLRSPAVLDRMAREVSAAAGGSGLVVEVGAGRGQLTSRLLGLGCRVVAIEIDSTLAAALRSAHPGEPRLELLEADVLEVDLRQLIASRTGRPAVVAGNLPYYITSPILHQVFDAGERLSQAVLLMQKEVAARVIARPGRRDFGYLSVLAQSHSRPELLFTVPPSAFRPPPKVTSALVRFVTGPRWAQWGVDDRRAFLDFARLCFQHKRKTLLNNLAGTFGRERLLGFEEAGRRAEQLGAERLAALWLTLNQQTRPLRTA